MKSFLTIIFLIFFAFSHAQLNQPQTWKDFVLQGKVKLIEENYIAKKKKNRETFVYSENPSLSWNRFLSNTSSPSSRILQSSLLIALRSTQR